MPRANPAVEGRPASCACRFPPRFALRPPLASTLNFGHLKGVAGRSGRGFDGGASGATGRNHWSGNLAAVDGPVSCRHLTQEWAVGGGRAGSGPDARPQTPVMFRLGRSGKPTLHGFRLAPKVKRLARRVKRCCYQVRILPTSVKWAMKKHR